MRWLIKPAIFIICKMFWSCSGSIFASFRDKSNYCDEGIALSIDGCMLIATDWRNDIMAQGAHE